MANMQDKKPGSTEAIMLSQEEYEKLLQGLHDFEEKFYTLIAGTDRFQIVPIPDDKGQIYTGRTLEKIKEDLASQGLKMLYRISHGDYALIVNPDSLRRVGIVPNGTAKEFSC
jgi:hypothetical protein